MRRHRNMTGQMPSRSVRAPTGETARDVARKAHDMASSVQQMSSSLLSRSKANVLQLEAKSLQNLLDRKAYQTDADELRARQLLRDVTMLRDSLAAKNARDAAAA
ncbi:hypothetical protein MTO96_004005 [Rhipicephalus appendiculatus]